jgi:hypothetical protein
MSNRHRWDNWPPDSLSIAAPSPGLITRDESMENLAMLVRHLFKGREKVA